QRYSERYSVGREARDYCQASTLDSATRREMNPIWPPNNPRHWTRLHSTDRIRCGVSGSMQRSRMIRHRRMAWRLMWIIIAVVHVKATAIALVPMAHRGWSNADLPHLVALSASNLFFLL